VENRQAVLESLYVMHSAAVHGCARFICNSMVADDITFRVFVETWGLIREDRPDTDLRLQLMSRTHRMAVEARRDAPPTLADISSTMTDTERSSLALVGCGGCSCRQASLILGVTEGEIMRTLNRSMKKLGPVWSPA
jgi:DNA-directed RNA polymerase specialized sigma24 family protein